MNKRVFLKLPWRAILGKSSLVIMAMLIYAAYCLISAALSFVELRSEKTQAVTLFCTDNRETGSASLSSMEAGNANDSSGNSSTYVGTTFEHLSVNSWTACRKQEVSLRYDEYSMQVCLVALEKDYLESALKIELPSYVKGQMPYIILNENSLAQMKNTKDQNPEILSEDEFLLKTFVLNESTDVRLYHLTGRQIVLTDQFLNSGKTDDQPSEGVVYAYTTMEYYDEILNGQTGSLSNIQSGNLSNIQSGTSTDAQLNTQTSLINGDSDAASDGQSYIQGNSQYMLQLVSASQLEESMIYLEGNGFEVDQSEQFLQVIEQWTGMEEHIGNALKLMAVIDICAVFMIIAQTKRWIAQHPHFVDYIKIAGHRLK